MILRYYLFTELKKGNAKDILFEMISFLLKKQNNVSRERGVN